MTDWLPPATAPKDGTEVLLLVEWTTGPTPWLEVHVGRWMATYGEWEVIVRQTGTESAPDEYVKGWSPIPPYKRLAQ